MSQGVGAENEPAWSIGRTILTLETPFGRPRHEFMGDAGHGFSLSVAIPECEYPANGASSHFVQWVQKFGIFEFVALPSRGTISNAFERLCSVVVGTKNYSMIWHLILKGREWHCDPVMGHGSAPDTFQVSGFA